MTGSTAQVGIVGLFQAVALLVLSPLGGAIGAYRVILSALSVDVLRVGARAGYGLLSSAPATGALIGTVVVFRLFKALPAGSIVLAATP